MVNEVKETEHDEWGYPKEIAGDAPLGSVNPELSA
jgi:hypothetical protein